MPKILIIGATGYIGHRLATHLLQTGAHTVYGVARTPSKARLLSSHEILPVPGSASDSAAYLSLIRAGAIDLVVDASGANAESALILADLKRVGAERIEDARRRGLKGTRRLGLVYTSGTWVHGSSLSPVDDLCTVGEGAQTPPPELVRWRPGLEQEVLAASDVLDVVIVRAALVYGGAGTIWASLFTPLLEGAKSGAAEVEVHARPESMPGLVHVDDVASGLAAAAERLPLISGTGVYPVFDLVTSQESMGVVLEATAKALGYKGKVNLVGVEGDAFADAMSTSFNGSSGRARGLLGWEPKRFGMAQRMDLYAGAWAASQE